MSESDMDGLYRYRHFLACFATIVGFCCIQWVASYLYLGNPFQPLWLTPLIFWRSGHTYFQFLAIMNVLIKPLFIYCLVLFALICLKNKRKH